jgi:hypothetical protein
MHFYLIHSVALPVNHESKTEDYAIFVFQSVSRTETADTKAAALVVPIAQ